MSLEILILFDRALYVGVESFGGIQNVVKDITEEGLDGLSSFYKLK